MTKFSILATGNIAKQMAETINQMEDVQLYAVASRTLSKAEDFKNKYGFKVAYGSYKALAQDNQSDIVYVATPHSCHYADTKMLLEHGHDVLCEKPLTVNKEQAQELYDLANKKKLLLADATWIRYMPFIPRVKQAAIKHDLGRLKMVISGLGISKLDSKRMVQPELAGGALLDLGIYPINNAVIFAHSPVKKIISTMTEYHTGVDESNAIILEFENGVRAILGSSMNGIMDEKTQLGYEKGRIELVGLPNPDEFRVYNQNNELIETVTVPEQISGYEYQVREMIQALNDNKLEMPSFSQEQSLEIIDIMDQVREQWDLVYPFESE